MLILSILPSGPNKYEFVLYNSSGSAFVVLLLNKVPNARAEESILESLPTTSSFSICTAFVNANRAGKYSITPPPRCGDNTTKSLWLMNPTSESRHPFSILRILKLPYLQSYVLTRPSKSVVARKDPSGELRIVLIFLGPSTMADFHFDGFNAVLFSDSSSDSFSSSSPSSPSATISNRFF